MRYLSNDNKVFNTIEECEEHEKKLTNDSQQRALKIREIREKWDKQAKLLDEVDELIDEYIDKYPSTFMKDLDFILKDIKKPEVVKSIMDTIKEIERLIK